MGDLASAQGCALRLSVVNLVSRTNSRHNNEPIRIVDSVNNAVVTHTYPILVDAALKFFTAGRTGIDGEIFDARKDPPDQVCRELFKFSFRT